MTHCMHRSEPELRISARAAVRALKNRKGAPPGCQGGEAVGAATEVQ